MGQTLSVAEIAKLPRQEIIDYGIEQIRRRNKEFKAEHFDRIRVFVKPDVVRVLFDMSRRYVPFGHESHEFSYSAEVIFSQGGTMVLLPDNLWIPDDESRAALTRFADIQLGSEGVLTVKDCGDFLEAMFTEGLDGEKACYRYDKNRGVRITAWHEAANPSLRTSILGLGHDDTCELQL
ncbi:MAG: hypothetical protein D6820_15105 [Lentisphaerae bacterium]|nr:MAG: hypothetical protein D6820_15105 [Lentisphaerota bacterium]